MLENKKKAEIYNNNDINDYCSKASKHTERLFKMIDIDGDGTLTQNEFLRVGD